MRSLLQAGGLLALMLVALGGCDSAALESAGPGATADANGLPDVSGPAQLDLECHGLYRYLTTVAGSWTISAGSASITSQYSFGTKRYAEVTGSGAPFTIEYVSTASGDAIASLNVTANPMLACG